MDMAEQSTIPVPRNVLNMTSVVGTAVLNLIQKQVIVGHFLGHIAVLPSFVKLDAVLKMVKAKVISAPERK